MAAKSRTLKLSILGDVDQLKKSLTAANKDVGESASKMGDFSRKVGVAFAAAGAAAGAYAIKIGIDGVKAAIADEAAQDKLATTLKNVTGATNAQIAAVEAQILKTSLLTGKTDDELRPSFDRLVRSTKDVEEAAKLQALALDISAGSGKSLEAVTNALAKSAEGQNTALGKLGVGISAADLKTMSFEAITAKLGNTFKDQASVQAETFQGKMDRLKVAIDEGKETVGAFILDAVTPLVSAFLNKVVPAISDVADKVGTKLAPVFKDLGNFLNDILIPAFKAFYNFIQTFVIPAFESYLVPIIKSVFAAFNQIATALKDNETNLKPLADAFRVLATFLRDTIAPILGGFVSGAISGIADVVAGLINVAGAVTNAVTKGFTAVKNFFVDVKDFIAASASSVFNPLFNGMKAVLNSIIGIWNKLDFAINITVPDWVPVVGGLGFKVADIFPDVPYLAKGGIVTQPTLAMIGEAGAEAVIPLSKMNAMGNTFNITVNGAVDAEGTARTLVKVLNNSYYRGTGGASNLVSA